MGQFVSTHVKYIEFSILTNYPRLTIYIYIYIYIYMLTIAMEYLYVDLGYFASLAGSKYTWIWNIYFFPKKS